MEKVKVSKKKVEECQRIVVVDLEALHGSFPMRAIPEIGVLIIDVTGSEFKVVDKRTYYINAVQGVKFTKKQLSDFWTKDTSRMRKFHHYLKFGKDETIVIPAVHCFIKKYISAKKNVKFVTDSCWFDLGTLNSLFTSYDLPTLNNLTGTPWHMGICLDSITIMMKDLGINDHLFDSSKNYARENVKKLDFLKGMKEHDSLYDCGIIFYQYVYINNVLRSNLQK